ncbi:hypothetical protein JCM8097_005851 [Rhodosporidiobolus ruineniae]
MRFTKDDLPDTKHRVACPTVDGVYAWVEAEDGRTLEVRGVAHEGNRTVAYLASEDSKRFFKLYLCDVGPPGEQEAQAATAMKGDEVTVEENAMSALVSPPHPSTTLSTTPSLATPFSTPVPFPSTSAARPPLPHSISAPLPPASSSSTGFAHFASTTFEVAPAAPGASTLAFPPLPPGVTAAQTARYEQLQSLHRLELLTTEQIFELHIFMQMDEWTGSSPTVRILHSADATLYADLKAKYRSGAITSAEHDKLCKYVEVFRDLDEAKTGRMRFMTPPPPFPVPSSAPLTAAQAPGFSFSRPPPSASAASSFTPPASFTTVDLPASHSMRQPYYQPPAFSAESAESEERGTKRRREEPFGRLCGPEEDPTCSDIERWKAGERAENAEYSEEEEEDEDDMDEEEEDECGVGYEEDEEDEEEWAATGSECH